jgi:hypothetical protein
MANYLQYIYDLDRYKQKCQNFASELSAQQERIVSEAVEDFKYRTRFRREQNLWDWCPIWLVVSENKKIFHNLPPLPWHHDGTPSYEFSPHPTTFF